MPLEVVNTFATVATLLVIAVTATAALVQLRHLRAANQITAIMSIVAEMQSAEFTLWRRFVRTQLPEKLTDKEFRDDLDSRRLGDPSGHPELKVSTFFEQIGVLAKYGFINVPSFLDLYAGQVNATWEELRPLVAILRRANVRQLENFEYLAVLSQTWLRTHPQGAFPKKMARLPVEDPWPGDRAGLVVSDGND